MIFFSSFLFCLAELKYDSNNYTVFAFFVFFNPVFLARIASEKLYKNPYFSLFTSVSCLTQSKTAQSHSVPFLLTYGLEDGLKELLTFYTFLQINTKIIIH